MKIAMETATVEQISDAKTRAKQKHHAVNFVLGSDPSRYNLLIVDLANTYTFGTDKYPCSLTEAYNLLVNYKRPGHPKPYNVHQKAKTPTTPVVPEVTEEANGVTETPDLSFVQSGENNPLPQVLCYNCQQYGHYAHSCPNPTVPRQTTGTQHVQFSSAIQECVIDSEDDDDDDAHFAFYQTQFVNNDSDDDDDDDHFAFYQTHFVHHQTVVRGGLPLTCILLDSCSTVSIISNPNYIENIRHCGHKGMRVFSNGGHKDLTLVADLIGLG